jgi:hypothetical protein
MQVMESLDICWKSSTVFFGDLDLVVAEASLLGFFWGNENAPIWRVQSVLVRCFDKRRLTIDPQRGPRRIHFRTRRPTVHILMQEASIEQFVMPSWLHIFHDRRFPCQ